MTRAVLGPVLLLVLSVSLVYFGTPISRVVRAFSIRVLPHEADIFAVVAVLVVMIMYLFG